jgi:alkylated DNA repair dioxygenase AlkB
LFPFEAIVAELFPAIVDPNIIPPIPGLQYLRVYITSAHEEQLRATIDAAPWDTTWQRRRQLYGQSYGRAEGNVSPLPEWGRAIATRIYRDGLSQRPFDHMLVNEYLPGQGISPHRDYETFDRTVVSLSLLSTCVMDFLRDGRREAMLLEPQSLLILSDEARYDWQHGIAARKKDRWQGAIVPRRRRLSITFRTSIEK